MIKNFINTKIIFKKTIAMKMKMCIRDRARKAPPAPWPPTREGKSPGRAIYLKYVSYQSPINVSQILHLYYIIEENALLA